MNRINRRRFVAVTSVTATSALLVACGNEPASEEALNPTQIPDVPGAPPTIAPLTSTPGADAGSADDGGDAGSPEATADAIVIEAHDDLTFSPNEVEVAPGQTVTLLNEGFMQHDLVSDDLGIGTQLLNNGETEDIVIPEDAAVGESFEFHCTVAGHADGGMVGTFTIVEAGAAAPAGEEEAPAEEDTGAADENAGGGSGEAITIEALDTLKFEPSEVEVAPGQTVTLLNQGFMQHDLVVDDWGIGTQLLNNGETEDIVIPEDAAVGESFEFHCTVAGHAEGGMVGTFTIVEAGAAAPAGEEETPAEEEATAEEDTGATDEGAGGGSGEAITIEALDTLKFEPSEVEVAPGQTVTLVNQGFMQHDLVVDDWGVGTQLLNNGETEDIVIPEDAAVGESFEFHCTVAGHAEGGMVGTFTIVEAGAAAPAGEGEEPAEEEATAEATAEEATAATAESTPAVEVTPPADNNPMATTVIGTQWQFTPSEFEMAPGGVITFQNETDMMMGISAEAWDDGAVPIIRSVSSGRSGEFTVPADAQVGDVIEFRSNLTEAQNQGMVGQITIVEGDGSATPAGEATPTGTDATPEAGGGTGNVIEVVMLDTFRFEPSEIEASVGDTLHFVNEGFMEHDAAVDAWSDDPLTPYLRNSETHDVVIPDSAEVGQQYEFYCTVAGHLQSGMKGTITIV